MTLKDLQKTNSEFFNSHGVPLPNYATIVSKLITPDELHLYETSSGYFIVSKNIALKDIDLNKRILYKSNYKWLLTTVSIAESVSLVPYDTTILQIKIDDLQTKINDIVSTGTSIVSIPILRHLECLVISMAELRNLAKSLNSKK